MLCSRSASLTSSTRTSSAIASRSLRRFSACLASLGDEVELLQLGQALDQRADVGAEQSGRSRRASSAVSSMVSCSSAAAMVASSSLRSVRIAATSSGCEKYGIARGALLLAVRLHGVDIGAVEQRLVGVRVVAADPLDQIVLPHHRGGLRRLFGCSAACGGDRRRGSARGRAGAGSASAADRSARAP